MPFSERDSNFKFKAAQAAIYIVCAILVDLGYFIGLAKSVLHPATRITYLDLIIDTTLQAFFLPAKDKAEKFAKIREAMLTCKKSVQVKTLQHFQEKCVPFSSAVPGAELFIRKTAAAIQWFCRP